MQNQTTNIDSLVTSTALSSNRQIQAKGANCWKCSSSRSDGLADSDELDLQCTVCRPDLAGAASMESLMMSLSCSSSTSIQQAARWLPLVINNEENNNERKSEGKCNAVRLDGTNDDISAEINIAQQNHGSSSCVRDYSANSETKEPLKLDKKTDRELEEGRTARATDCCNQLKRKAAISNQFNTCQLRRPCLRHKHSSSSVYCCCCCCELERSCYIDGSGWRQHSENIPTNCSATINNKHDCANRWQAEACCGCLDYFTNNNNYCATTKTLFSSGKDAPKANEEEKKKNSNNPEEHNNSKQTRATSFNSLSSYAQTRAKISSSPEESASSLSSILHSSQTSLSSSHLGGFELVDLKVVDFEASKASSSLTFASSSFKTHATSGQTIATNHKPSIKDNHHHSLPILNLNSRDSQQANRLATTTTNEVMEILQQHQSNNNNSNNINQILIQDRLILPKTYPNNTLIVDLNKCHRNITSLWPKTTQATATTLSNIKNCWPFSRNRARQRARQSDLVVEQNSNRVNHARKFSFQMPDSLSRTNVQLKSVDYDKALSVLTSDVRYQLHLLLYRQVQTIWMLLSTILCILVPILVFADLEALMIVGACFVWLGLQIIGAFVTTHFRKKLDEMLEKSVAQVNSFFMDYNLMLGVINFGSLLSKAKLMVPMLYFDTSQCREQIESILSTDSRKEADGNSSEHILDYSKIDLPLTKPNAMALAQSQLAKKIVLRYSQRWISYFEKRKLMFTDDRIRPRHLSTGKCLCQFIEEHFRNTEHRHQQEAKYNSTNIINSYTNTKATLVINGKEQQETIVKPQVIRNYTLIAPNVPIPTLSRLVSLKEDRKVDQSQIDMTLEAQPEVKLLTRSQTNGFVQTLWQPTLNNNNNDNNTIQVPLSPRASIQTATSNPDVCLEMGGDLIGGGDDLVKKLRLLLELRKNELQSIDGSLFSKVLYKTPQQLIPPNPDSQSTQSIDGDHDNGVPIKEKTGKKFFSSQREGLFFLGTNSVKKSQQKQQQNVSRNHVLEIC